MGKPKRSTSKPTERRSLRSGIFADRESATNMIGREFSEQLHAIRDVHIEVESILQSLSELQSDKPCLTCTSVCCREEMCRESIDSDFLRFLLGPMVDGYDAESGWFVAGAGCRLSYGRPLVCYEFFCERFDMQESEQCRQLSRALKTVYSRALAGQHILAVDDITKISAHRLKIIHAKLENLRDVANEALRRSLGEKLGLQPIDGEPA
jgi:hypothetical protein